MGIYSNLRDNFKRRLIKKVILGLGDTSDKNLVRLANLIEKISTDQETVEVVMSVKKFIIEKHPAVNFIKRILKEINPNCRDKFVENLIINGLILNRENRKKNDASGGCSPYTILISPTMRCNLKCIGCYAGNYSMKDDLGYEYFDKIITEGKDMGVGFYTILGGEPLVVKDDLFKICRKHSDIYFQFYTNGCLIDEEMAKELAELGNLMPVLSVEGYEKETDTRRGKGVYKKVMEAMSLLKKYRIPFGYSVAVTNKNADLVSSEKFIDFMIKNGAFIGWYFLYMPIGRKPDLKLMPTPEQRKMLREKWINIRANKPIFVIDFWNDAPFVGGCIAGKNYVHINSKGDVEPCIFTHFAVDNIKNKSLSEVMKSDFFKELRKRQPFNDNLYMPCMWIDNPDVGKEMIEKYGCYPTHDGADTILKDKNLRKGLYKYSKEVKKNFDPIWEEELKKKASEKK
jgi:MoaA/NifB/PqqE/SkfB family radical SAM enzyme